MLTTIRKYVRAFVLALRLTVRGEKPPLLRVRDDYPQLAAWWEKTSALVRAVEVAADAEGIDADARAHFMIHVDKRDISMSTILATVRYHAEHEYPYLLAHRDEFNPLTLQAINLNDRFLTLRLGEAVSPSLRPALESLNAHLDSIPKV